MSLAVGCSSGKPLASNAASNGRIANAVDLGKVAPGTEFDFVVGVELRDEAALHKFFGSQASSHDLLGASDFGDLFGPSAAEYQRIVTWLKSEGLTITRTTSARTTISVHGTAENIEHAFGAELHNYSDPQGAFVASATGLTPSANGGSISSTVGGFDGAKPWHSHMVRLQNEPRAGVQLPPSLGAKDLETRYNAVSTGTTPVVASPGMGQTVVILGTGDAPLKTDLAGYFTTFTPYGLSTMPGTYDQILVGGANRDDPQTAQNEGGENLLDVQMVAAFAPYAKIEHVLTATNSPGLFTDGISYILENYTGANLATAVSVSYGGCERESSGEIPVMNALFAQALAAGQTWFFASGDSGTDTCGAGSTNTIESVDWPASSPYVIGVGGTMLNSSGTEVPWDGNSGQGMYFAGAGGGGASEAIAKPAFQTGVGTGASDGARDVPDVSAIAGDPGIFIYEAAAIPQLGVGTVPIGGTSAATPMWAGIWANLTQSKGGPITDSLTKIYALKGAGFRDITTGDNGAPDDTAGKGYQAAVGYDMASGWGVPNLATLLTSWK